MIFFEINPRQDFAGYLPDKVVGEVSDRRILDHSRKIETVIREYLGNPPRKPRKHGDFHRSANSFFVNSAALVLFEEAARGNLLKNKTTIIGRENEDIYQVWVTNFVDCLDIKNTVAGSSSGFYKGKIGVIKRAVFDEGRWDGSDLFVVPQDPSFCLFCTDEFLKKWKNSGFKGILFTRFLMDPDGIRC